MGNSKTPYSKQKSKKKRARQMAQRSVESRRRNRALLEPSASGIAAIGGIHRQALKTEDKSKINTPAPAVVREHTVFSLWETLHDEDNACTDQEIKTEEVEIKCEVGNNFDPIQSSLSGQESLIRLPQQLQKTTKIQEDIIPIDSPGHHYEAFSDENSIEYFFASLAKTVQKLPTLVQSQIRLQMVEIVAKAEQQYLSNEQTSYHNHSRLTVCTSTTKEPSNFIAVSNPALEDVAVKEESADEYPITNDYALECQESHDTMSLKSMKKGKVDQSNGPSIKLVDIANILKLPSNEHVFFTPVEKQEKKVSYSSSTLQSQKSET